MTPVRAAVDAASEVLAHAAAAARDRHATADRDAAELVADQADQDAAATRYRVDAEAGRVRRAAEVAAVRAHQWEDDPPSRRDLLRAAEIAAAVHAAAVSLSERTRALARSVAHVVADRALQVRTTRSLLHRSLQADEAATAAALEAAALAAARVAEGGGGPPERLG